MYSSAVEINQKKTHSWRITKGLKFGKIPTVSNYLHTRKCWQYPKLSHHHPRTNLELLYYRLSQCQKELTKSCEGVVLHVYDA